MISIQESFLKQIELEVGKNPDFRVMVEDDTLKASTLSHTLQERLSRANDVSYFLKQLYENRLINLGQAKRISHVFYFYFRYLSQVAPSHRDQFQIMALNTQFGYTIDFAAMPKDFKKFILTNHLHHILTGLNIELHRAEIPLEQEGVLQFIPWESLQQKFTPEGGTAFYFQEVLVFELNDDYQFTGNYCVTELGIRKKSDELFPLRIRKREEEGPEGEHDYVLKVIVTSFQNMKRERPSCPGAHCAFILKDPHSIYVLGKSFSENDQPSFGQAFTKASISNPDVLALFPANDLQSSTEATFYISQKTFSNLKEQFQQDFIAGRQNKLPHAMLDDNCISYARGIMRTHLNMTPEMRTDLLSGIFHYVASARLLALGQKINKSATSLGFIVRPVKWLSYGFTSTLLGIFFKCLSPWVYSQPPSWKDVLLLRSPFDSPDTFAKWLKVHCSEPINLEAL